VVILIDVAIFTFAYAVELPQLKNQIKSVESTVLGWLVCLMCYPPLGDWVMVGADLFRGQSTGALGQFGTALLGVATVALWLVYVSASVALGAKASNLTNRGIVSRGPYRFVRHPAYISKLLIWSLPAFLGGFANLSLLLFLWFCYSVRAWTEENHLSADPDYIEYKKRVPWRFIPGVL
jgi:protein-S-isoprenylcysteine O-methyltransferase Ste14